MTLLTKPSNNLDDQPAEPSQSRESLQIDQSESGASNYLNTETEAGTSLETVSRQPGEGTTDRED
jgi:hypothetical protein